jgi:hypothetical protein
VRDYKDGALGLIQIAPIPEIEVKNNDRMLSIVDTIDQPIFSNPKSPLVLRTMELDAARWSGVLLKYGEFVEEALQDLVRKL